MKVNTLAERNYIIACLNRDRIDLENKEEEFKLRGNYNYALIVNGVLFDLSMQLFAINTRSSFEKSFIHNTIQRSFFYQAQLNSGKRGN